MSLLYSRYNINIKGYVSIDDIMNVHNKRNRFIL